MPFDLRSPEFAQIRGRLARAFIAHKADLGPEAATATDQQIVDRLEDITALLLAASGRALATHNVAWLDRYRWFAQLVEGLADDLPAAPLDG